VAIRDNVAALKKAGRTLEETVAAKPTAAHDAKWAQFVIDPPFLPRPRAKAAADAALRIQAGALLVAALS
jgi:hypothetical protein